MGTAVSSGNAASGVSNSHVSVLWAHLSTHSGGDLAMHSLTLQISSTPGYAGACMSPVALVNCFGRYPMSTVS